jgi:hypothetical protein
MIKRTRTVLSIVAVAAMFSTACSRHGDDSNGSSQASPSAAAPTSVATVGAATAMPVSGATAVATSPPAAAAPGAAAAFTAATGKLQTVSPADSTFDVHWNDATKVVPADTVAAAYRGAVDGGTFQFDAAKAPDLATLAPQSIVVFSGLAVRKVVSVKSDGTTISIATVPAALDEAVHDGHIAWHMPVDFSRVAFEPPPGFHRVIAASDGSWESRLFEPADAAGNEMTFKSDVDDVKVTLTPQGSDLHIVFDAKKTAQGGGYVDMHAVGELDDLSSAADIAIANGTTTNVSDTNTLHGKVNFTWSVAFDKEHGDEDRTTLDESEIEKLPLHFSYPFVVGVVPMELKLSSGFQFSPFFSSKATVAQGSYDVSFGGSATMDQSASADAAPSGAAPSEAGPEANLEGTGDIDSYGGTLSLAALGLSATVMMPKVQLAFGIPDLIFDGVLGESSGGPYVALMTQANFVATGPLSIVPCERRQLSVIGIAGADATLFGKSLARSEPKTVFKRDYTLVVPANIKICQPSDK